MDKTKILILLIIVLAIFFRFYRLTDFQYWSTDDEIFSAVVTRMVFNHTITLVSPNATLGISLGSFLHLMSIPIYIIASFDPIKILVFGSILGVLTTLLIYLTGREMFNKSVGLLASFFYAISFLASFADRRWWPLTLDPILCVLALLSAFRIAVKKDYKFLLPLMISVSFGWHSDPTLAVVAVFMAFIFLVYKLPLFKRGYIPGIIYVIVALLPLVFFEVRHSGAISYPIFHFLTRGHSSGVFSPVIFTEAMGHITRAFFILPDNGIEKYLMYCRTCGQPAFGVISELIVMFLLVLPIFLLNKAPSVKVLYLYFLAFIVGTVIHSSVPEQAVYQHFYVVVWPAIFLLVAVALNYLWERKMALIVVIFMVFVFFSNFNTLINSNMKYPLKDKLAATNYAINQIGNSRFSLEISGEPRLLDGIGGLFLLKKYYPSNADYYAGWDWIYKAYSLYGIAPTSENLPINITFKPGRTYGNIDVVVSKL